MIKRKRSCSWWSMGKRRVRQLLSDYDVPSLETVASTGDTEEDNCGLTRKQVREFAHRELCKRGGK